MTPPYVCFVSHRRFSTVDFHKMSLNIDIKKVEYLNSRSIKDIFFTADILSSSVRAAHLLLITFTMAPL